MAGRILESDFWVGLFAPRHTPPTIISTLNEAVKNASRAPAFLAEMEARGYEVVTSTASALADRVERDTDTLGRIIRTAGIHI